MHFRLSLSAIAALSLHQGVAGARAGANVYGCVYFASSPAESLTVDFTAGSVADNCMGPSGRNTSVTVTDAGLSCASIGYVAELAETRCRLFEKSFWTLSYSGGSYSGSARTEWSSSPLSNECELSDASPGTNACPSKALCKLTDLMWDRDYVMSLHIIFKPGTAGESGHGHEKQIPME